MWDWQSCRTLDIRWHIFNLPPIMIQIANNGRLPFRDLILHFPRALPEAPYPSASLLKAELNAVFNAIRLNIAAWALQSNLSSGIKMNWNKNTSLALKSNPYHPISACSVVLANLHLISLHFMKLWTLTWAALSFGLNNFWYLGRNEACVLRQPLLTQTG